MANTNTPRSARHRGWYFDGVNGRIEAYYNGTLILGSDANDTLIPQAATLSSTLTVDGAQTLTGITTHSDEVRIANGKNLRIGTISAFVTTEPTNAIVMKTGTEFAGAITTSGGLMSSDTVVRKVIAAGTVSNVET